MRASLDTVPRTAMMLAAGMGSRMRPVTDTMPKPLVRVGGKCLIDWMLDLLGAAGVERAVVNVHYLAAMLSAHLAGRKLPHVVVSDETARLLDTGGGLAKALPLLGADPFFVCNCDAIVLDGASPMARRMASAWHDGLDVLMLLQAKERAHGFDGAGDFFMDADGRLTRKGTAAAAPFVYAGVLIMHPRAMAGEKAEPFSLNKVWDRAIAQDRMRGLVHDGRWFHVGTPEAIGATEILLSANQQRHAAP